LRAKRAGTLTAVKPEIDLLRSKAHMTDRQAAEAAGLNPESAAYTKAKPRVRAYMAEHRAALHEKLVAEESEGLRKLNIGRDKLLAHPWYLASLPPEVTRGNISGQLKATAMFASFGGLFPEASAAQPEQPSVKGAYIPSPLVLGSAGKRSQPAIQSCRCPARRGASCSPGRTRSRLSGRSPELRLGPRPSNRRCLRPCL
jgi:hypothetical protein